MTQEEKQLLLKDLCARLPYGIKMTDGVDTYRLTSPFLYKYIEMELKPYLRPISSMTEEEREEFNKVGGVMSYNPKNDTWAISAFTPEAYDWLNNNAFDYRGLIPMGLALEATKEMYE